VIFGSQKEVVPYSLVVGDDWAVRKWSKYHIRSMSDGASAMPKTQYVDYGSDRGGSRVAFRMDIDLRLQSGSRIFLKAEATKYGGMDIRDL
jgi:hypothetical protein